MQLTSLVIECILIGFGAGLIYGIFGGGSGLIMAPGYYYLTRYFPLTHDHRMQIAVATTAAASAIIGLFSSRVQWKANNIDFSLIKKLTPGLTIGTFVAVALLNIIPSDFLKHLFGVVVIFVAFWMWFYNQAKDLKKWSLNGISNFMNTFFIGLLWFLLGIAVFTVPYLHKAGVSMRSAVGSASFTASVFSALAAILLMFTGYFTVHASATHIGYVNILLVALSFIPSAIAGYFGSRISNKVPQHMMKKIYSVLVCVVGVLMLVC